MGKLLILFSLLFLGPVIACTQSEWSLFKEEDGIKVFFREAENSNIKEVKIQTRFQAHLSSMVALIGDVKNYRAWMDHCKVVKKLESSSPTDYVYYNLANFPWPLLDREYVMKSQMTQDPENLTVHIKSVAVPDFIPRNKGYIRVPETLSAWTIQPIENGFLELEYYLKSDPGGALPAWLVNIALKTQPFKTMQKLRELAQSEAYSNMQLGYIQESGQ